MSTARYLLSPWTPDETAAFEAWGHDRRDAMQAGMEAALALMLGEDLQRTSEDGPLAPLRGEGETVAALLADLLDDLLAQMAVHGPMQAATLDGVLQRDRGGFVAWGYLHPLERAAPLVTFERAGEVDVVTETPAEIRLRARLRRLA